MKVFISYSSKDQQWVKEWLMPRLEQAGLTACIDFRDFQIGLPTVINIEEAIENCDHTLLILTPNWLASEWTHFEALLLQTQDLTGLKRRIFPVMLQPCELPKRLAIFTYADFKDKKNWDTECARLIDQMRKPSPYPSPQRGEGINPPLPSSEGEGRGEGGCQISLNLPTTNPELFGRDNELALLDQAWDNPQQNIVIFVAWGGVGKTALINTWLLNMQKDNFRGAALVFGWTFYSRSAQAGSQASDDRFIADALAWFGDPDPNAGSPADKGKRLARLIKQQHTLLVLDGLEPLQYPPGALEGKLKDQALYYLLRDLAMQNPGLCLISTRTPVDDLRNFFGATVVQKKLEHLSVEAGAALLRGLGVQGTPKDLQEAIVEFGGHALALNLLGTYLKTVYNGDVRQRDKIKRMMFDDDEDPRSSHARWVMASYETWLTETQKGQRELNILRLMGLFDRPAEIGAIQAVLAEPVIPGLTEGLDAADPKWSFAVQNLRELRLLAENPTPNPSPKGRGLSPSPIGEGAGGEVLDCHPLVREHFGDRLRNENPAAWTAAHRRLYEYYKKLPEKEYPDTLEEMEPLFAAVAHGCRAGQHQAALDDVYWERIQRKKEFYPTKKFGAFGADLATLANFFEVPWSQPAAGLTDADKAVVLSWTGFRLRALGRLSEATQPIKACLEDYIKRNAFKDVAIAAGNLSELYLTLGDVLRAVEYARQSVDFADRTNDAFQRYGKRTSLADALHQQGDFSEAESLFHEAESIQKENDPNYPLLYGLAGFRFCDLLLSQGAYQEVLTRAEKTLEWATQAKWLLDIALDNLSIGRALLLQAQAENLPPGSPSLFQRDGDGGRVLAYLHQAVDGLRESGRQDILPISLFARAAFYRVVRDFANAREDLREAQEIAERGAMGLYLVDYHLEAARVNNEELRMKNEESGMRNEESLRKDMAGHVAAAETLIAKTGYHRRDRELEELLQGLHISKDYT